MNLRILLIRVDDAMSEEGSVVAGESVVAVDIGGGTTKLALVDRQGAMQSWRSFPSVAETGDAFVTTVIAAVRDVRDVAARPPVGVSVAVAGFVDADGNLEYNPNLPWLEHAPLASRLREQLHMPVIVDADSNAACVAEYIFGQGRQHARQLPEPRRFLCLTGGTGLGVGMIVDGRLLRVAHGCMGDAGHIIVAPEGAACSCGGRGCAEAMLSTAALGARYAVTCGGSEDHSFRTLVQQGRIGEPRAVALLSDAGYWLGIAAASLAAIFFPDRIAIAGGLSQAGEALMISARKSFQAHGGQYPLAHTSLVAAGTGEHATLLGAAASFFHPQLL